MTLDEYMKANGFTDESFGERIGKSRLSVFKYRHGRFKPDKEAMNLIVEVTKGQVTPNDFYNPPAQSQSQ